MSHPCCTLKLELDGSHRRISRCSEMFRFLASCFHRDGNVFSIGHPHVFSGSANQILNCLERLRYFGRERVFRRGAKAVKTHGAALGCRGVETCRLSSVVCPPVARRRLSSAGGRGTDSAGPSSGRRIPLLAVLLTVATASSILAQPSSVGFAFSPASDSTGYWPNENITVQAEWEEGVQGVDSALCLISNHDNLDVLAVQLGLVDTVNWISEVTLEFGTSWILAAELSEDSMLQCWYGHRLTATVDGVSDSVRILVETATLSIGPDTVSVGGDFSVTLDDRDRNHDVDSIDSVMVRLTSMLGQGDSTIALVETGVNQGHFSFEGSLIYAFDSDSEGFPVLAADTLLVSYFDSLAIGVGWDQAQGEHIEVQQGVTTRSAQIRISHPVYGELVYMPLGDDSLLILLEEPDLAGASELDLTVFVFQPDGEVRDSVELVLVEDDRGAYAGVVFVAGDQADIEASAGDSLTAHYTDMADDTGLPRMIRKTVLLGVEIVTGEISESRWTPALPYLLVGSIQIPTGNSLVVDPGCIVAALPDSSIAWSVFGEVMIGDGGIGDSVLVCAASGERRPGLWEGFVVEGGSLHARGMVLQDARVGIAATSGASVTVQRSRIEQNGVAEDELAQWRQARGDPHAIRLLARTSHKLRSNRGTRVADEKTWPTEDQREVFPGGISAGSADLRVENSLIRSNAGYGISASGAQEGLTIGNCRLVKNSLDGILALDVDTGCSLSTDTLIGNAAGGVFSYGSTLTLDSCVVSTNSLQGVYLVDGSASIAACTVTGNLGGGVMQRDDNGCSVTRSLLGSNHLFGFDLAWNCSLSVNKSVLAANGGNGVAVDYDGWFEIDETTLAYNRNYEVLVGSWCTWDTLKTEDCWWGQDPPGTDSTGTNLDAVWDGFDSHGLPVVDFHPWLHQPPEAPAPWELQPVGGEILRFSSPSYEQGDTLQVELVVDPARDWASFAPVALASSRDTLILLLLPDESGEGGTYRNSIVFTDEPDLLSSDRLASDGLRPSVWWLADSSVVLGSHPYDVPTSNVLRLNVSPNPFRSWVRLAWEADHDPKIELYDLAGRRIWRSDKLSEHGIMRFGGGSNDPELSPGAYIMLLREKNRTKSLRVVKVR